jgi:hypothetical protein
LTRTILSLVEVGRGLALGQSKTRVFLLRRACPPVPLRPRPISVFPTAEVILAEISLVSWRMTDDDGSKAWKGSQAQSRRSYRVTTDDALKRRHPRPHGNRSSSALSPKY